MNLNLANKVIIVIDGAKGIGEGIVKALVAENAIPVIVGRNESDNLKMIESVAGKAFQVVAELTDPTGCENSVKKIIEKFDRIDGLVNNAGMNDGVDLEKGNYREFVASLHKNLVHYYLMAHHVLPYLKKTKGAIVNIGSKTAETGQGSTSVNAAFNGINALTREWAVELLPYNIRVNELVVPEYFTPEWMKTCEDPQEKSKSVTQKNLLEKRMTTVEEIAAMVVFLLSEKSSHTTGQIIHVDGGYIHPAELYDYSNTNPA
jgi:L-fucose dehydrogenase